MSINPLTAYLQTLSTFLDAPKDSKKLSLVYQDLSQRYKANAHEIKSRGFLSLQESLSYIHARAPATFAVVQHILAAHPSTAIKTILELGAGPGTSVLAAALAYAPDTITAIEQDASMIRAAEHALKQHFPHTSVKAICGDVHKTALKPADLVLSSYLHTEMSETAAITLYTASLKATLQRNLVVLPGTPGAFKLLLQLRDVAIKAGFTILAPCPHQQKCPMATNADAWCHFRQRLPRSRLHQEIKKADLSYEDEPYCYLLVARDDAKGALSHTVRIVETPKKRPGHILLDVCATDGVLTRVCVTKRDKARYKAAKEAQWGDAWVMDEGERS